SAAQRRSPLYRDSAPIAARGAPSGAGPQLSSAHEYDLCRVARCGHDGPALGPARAHRDGDHRTTVAARATAASGTPADCGARLGPNGCPHRRWRRPCPDKVLSVFEPHTEAIRKGKHVKPTEFGKLVTIQEAEHQIITAYAVHNRRPADKTLWV